MCSGFTNERVESSLKVPNTDVISGGGQELDQAWVGLVQPHLLNVFCVKVYMCMLHLTFILGIHISFG